MINSKNFRIISRKSLQPILPKMFSSDAFKERETSIEKAYFNREEGKEFIIRSEIVEEIVRQIIERSYKRK